MTKEQAIEKLNDNFGSIYSKEDVINLLNSIETPQSEMKLDEKLIDIIIDTTISKTCTYYMDTLPDNYEVDSNRIEDVDVRTYGTEINIESVDIDLSSVFRDAVETNYTRIRKSVKDTIDIELGLTKDEEQDENN
jgi:hypothetical protein